MGAPEKKSKGLDVAAFLDVLQTRLSHAKGFLVTYSVLTDQEISPGVFRLDHFLVTNKFPYGDLLKSNELHRKLILRELSGHSGQSEAPPVNGGEGTK